MFSIIIFSKKFFGYKKNKKKIKKIVKNANKIKNFRKLNKNINLTIKICR